MNNLSNNNYFIGVETDLNGLYLGALNHDNGWDVKVYLINISDQSIGVKLLQGSFQGDEDTLIDLGHSKHRALIIPAKGYVEIDHMDDPGQLDFTTYYNLLVGRTVYYADVSGRSFDSNAGEVKIPLLNEKGYLAGFGRVGDAGNV